MPISHLPNPDPRCDRGSDLDIRLRCSQRSRADNCNRATRSCLYTWRGRHRNPSCTHTRLCLYSIDTHTHTHINIITRHVYCSCSGTFDVYPHVDLSEQLIKLFIQWSLSASACWISRLLLSSYYYKLIFKAPCSLNFKGTVSSHRWPKPSPVLITPTYGGMARLSGPEWPG